MIWSESDEGNVRPATRFLAAATAVAVAMTVLAPAARADCQTDINGIMKRRLAAVAAVNATAKKNGGKLDPILACPQLRSLAAIEGEASAYFAKNGEWCNLPPDFTAKMNEARAKTASFATKACAVAVKIKDMQKQQAAQQAAEALPKLPTGPL